VTASGREPIGRIPRDSGGTTTSTAAAELLLWLFVLNLGIAFGAGLYEARIVVARWLRTGPNAPAGWDAEAARRDDTGRRFWAFVTTGPLTLLTLASLLAAGRAGGPVRSWMWAAALAALADRLVTFAYFIPTMVRLMRTADASEATVATAARWARLNYGRLAILLVAWLAALKAFAVFYAERG
jgi:hypothetical protein